VTISRFAGTAKGGKSEKPQKKVLIQLKGKNRIHVRQVELCAKSLNKADVYILDMGDKVYRHYVAIPLLSSSLWPIFSPSSDLRLERSRCR